MNEPFASAVIYPASLAAWVYLALAARRPDEAPYAALGVFLAGLCGTLVLVRRVKINQEREDLIQTVVGIWGEPEANAIDEARRQWDAHCPRRRMSDLARFRGWTERTVGRLERQGRLRRDGELLHLDDGSLWSVPRRRPSDDRATAAAPDRALGVSSGAATQPPSRTDSRNPPA